MKRRHTSLSIEGAVATLTLARPDIRNAITGPEMLDEVVGTLDHPPPEVRILIVTGQGTAFSAGGNVHEMGERAGIFSGTPYQIAEAYRTTIQRLTRSVLSTDIVTIAAVNGPAVGAGFDLVLACDLRLGTSRAWFAHTFIDLGIIPGDGGAWLLPRVVGWQHAAEIAFTARRVDADEAADLDILLRVVEPDRLMETVSHLAADIAAKPAHSLRLTKRLLRHARSMDLEGFLELSAALQAMSHAEPEHEQAVERFLERWRTRD
ncbi:MAG: enoyl-CoA hydratase-related protein [Acidimicrobiia bacterium]